MPAATRSQRVRTRELVGRKLRSKPVRRSTVPAIVSSSTTWRPRSRSPVRPSAATTSSNGRIRLMSPCSRVSTRLRRPNAACLRARRKSSPASTLEKPVRSGGMPTCLPPNLGPMAVESGSARADGSADSLKTGALGFVSNLVIGVASTAPGYSLAATLGFIVAITGVGLQAPAVLLVSFIPMLLIAAAYYYMNRADPDCGTTFSWVTKAMGPRLGWLGGGAIVVADIIVMANLAQIAGLYSFLLVGWQSAADSTAAVTLVGVVWIAIMTAICVIGIELSARTQVGLLSAEIITLVIFSVVALVAVATGNAGENAVDPSLSWINPL